VNQLTTLGDLEDDEKVVLKYLHITRPKFKQLVISIETLLDVPTLSIEEATGRLKMAEDDGIKVPVVEGELLLIEEEWREKAKKKETGEGSCGGSNGDRGSLNRGGGNRGRGRGRGGRGENSGTLGGRRNSDKCHRCGKPGHWATTAATSNPRRMSRLLQPKKRSQVSYSSRLTRSTLEIQVSQVAAMS
jgi:hypothetical protein